MNRYHQKHPDPEVRQKYVEWRKAMDNYEARKHGFNSPEEKNKHEHSKEAASFKQMLMKLGNNVMRSIGRANIKNNIRKQRRTGGNRGS